MSPRPRPLWLLQRTLHSRFRLGYIQEDDGWQVALPPSTQPCHSSAAILSVLSRTCPTIRYKSPTWSRGIEGLRNWPDSTVNVLFAFSAQGAMFAPLALKYCEIYSKYFALSWLTTFVDRVPVQNIQVDTTTTTPTSTAVRRASKARSDHRRYDGRITCGPWSESLPSYYGVDGDVISTKFPRLPVPLCNQCPG